MHRFIPKSGCLRYERARSLSSKVTVHNSLLSGSTTIDVSGDGSLPLSSKRMNWYACGPTVYDDTHIGHARTYVCTDIIRRILAGVFNCNITYAMGLTDVDDKIVDKARARRLAEGGWTAVRQGLTAPYTAEFMRDMAHLGVLPPDALLRVTDHIPEIVLYVQAIADRGLAYYIPPSDEAGDSSKLNSELSPHNVVDVGGVYFDVSTFEKRGGKYGKLGRVESYPNSDGEGNVANVSAPMGMTTLTKKKDKRDFALWKVVGKKEAASADSLTFPSPWGAGRPGWHIECSALTHAFFGSRVDIHSGGIDLVFPHHTNEIAQCEAHNCADCLPNAEWVQLWMHIGHLYIHGRKMSKSLKNFITVRQFLDQDGHCDVMNSLMIEQKASGDCVSSVSSWLPSPSPAADMRLCFLLHHYRSPIHFGPDVLREAVYFRQRIENFVNLVKRTEDYVCKSETSDLTSTGTVGLSSVKPVAASIGLLHTISECQLNIREAFASDFDTPGAMQCLLKLIQVGTEYASVDIVRQNNVHFPLMPLHKIVLTIRETLELLGVQLVCFGDSKVPDGNESNIEEKILSATQVMDELVTFRANMRKLAVTGLKELKRKSPSGSTIESDAAVGPVLKEMLRSCDSLRDDILPTKFDAHVSDMPNHTSSWIRKPGNVRE